MSALPTPGQDELAHQAQDVQQQLHVPPPLTADLQPAPSHNADTPPVSEGSRKRESPPPSPSAPCSPGRRPAKAPSVRRACAACHAGKTRCSEVLPCQVSVRRRRLSR